MLENIVKYIEIFVVIIVIAVKKKKKRAKTAYKARNDEAYCCSKDGIL